MFLFGILSSPLPYLLMAVFYFVGFATGMFNVKSDSEPNAQIQVKNIQVEPQTNRFKKSERTFQFQEYAYELQKKDSFSAIPSIEPPPVAHNEKLIYFVQDLKIHFSSSSEYYFCRPPPTRS